MRISALSMYPRFEPAKIHSRERMKATNVHSRGKIAVGRMVRWGLCAAEIDRVIIEEVI